MARKKNSSWISVGSLIFIIAVLASVPKGVWIAIAAIALSGYLINRIIKKTSRKQESKTDASQLSGRTSPIFRVSMGYSGNLDSNVPVDSRITSELCWVPPGRTANVGSFLIPEGMIYFGSKLPAAKGYSIEPALIDPTLPIRRIGVTSEMPYWPSYSEVSAEVRGEFIGWLAGGRREPVQIGCVFLYLYGLERRVLFDCDLYPQTVEAELPFIIAELERLLSLYSGSRSFQNYASDFLDFIRLRACPQEKAYEKPGPELNMEWRQLSGKHKIALGQVAVDGVGLPADWAFSWLMNDEMTFIRKPIERCPSEFQGLFLALYKSKYPQGMRLPRAKTRLDLSYRPASSSFGNRIDLPVGELPDVTVLERPINDLRKLAIEATQSLAPYSRFIGRFPEKRGAMDAIVLLPPVLWPGHGLESLVGSLKECGIERNLIARDLSEIARYFSNWCALNKEQAASFASALEYFGVGLEPDTRWGGDALSEETPLVLFSIPPQERGKKPSQAYLSAALTIHLAAAVSVVDGLSDEEEQHLILSIEKMEYLEIHERRRLRAHLKWLLLSKPSLVTFKKRIQELNKSQRNEIGAFAVSVAQIEGGLAPDEMKILAKIFRMLELPEESLYSEAHAAAIEPVPVRSVEPTAPRHRIPQRPSRSTVRSGSQLDTARVSRLREESIRVSELLGSIFVEPESIPPPAETKEATSQEITIAGLDLEHSRLVKILLGRDRWTRAALEDLASDRGLMLDGALERLNEACIDTFGEPIVEGIDPVDINKTILKEIEKK